jgi:hypothetical protein
MVLQLAVVPFRPFPPDFRVIVFVCSQFRVYCTHIVTVMTHALLYRNALDTN